MADSTLSPAEGTASRGADPAPAALTADEETEQDQRPVIAVCAKCQHMRMRPKSVLFSPADLQTPAILKAQLERDQQNQQRAQQEQQRVNTGLPFDYEPHHFAWCAAYTAIELWKRAKTGDAAAIEQFMAEGAGVMNPVSGELSPYYALCSQKNPDGQCPRYEPS